jgi:predicted RNA binding protein YcfA (HicA-like mRNA interferase family)
MVKPLKLYDKLLQSTDRTVSFRDFLALIEAFGFAHARTKGSHRSYAHANCTKLMVVQPIGKDAKRYQVREFLDLVREFELQMNA